MSKFKYSDNEMDINKVLKMNQDLTEAMLFDKSMHATRSNADASIKESMELLCFLGKNKEVAALKNQVVDSTKTTSMKCKPQIEEWSDLVNLANNYYPMPILLEDIMTELEINSAFEELNSINREFSRKTSIINKTDLSFLAIATALQVVKILIFPYIARKFEYGNSFDPDDRLAHNDKSIEKEHREGNDKFRDKHLKKNGKGYWINILYQTPPYDITKGSKDLGINMHGKYHRMYTLGHDPILGWLFGTLNILTDCITFNNFNSNRISRIDPITGKKNMIITPEIVTMPMMFEECISMIKADRINLPAAIFAQASHLKSDEFTKLGLPVPIISSVNEEFASKLYSENYDSLCFARDAKIVGASFMVSKIVDIIISLTHSIFRLENESQEIFEVRTRKILLISNAIASTSTLINAGITKNPKNLDIGSLLNTVTRLFTDIRFISKIKQEFIENEISNRLEAEILEIDTMYNSF